MKNPLIINQPGLQRPLDRALWATVTWAFWSLWFVLWLPLITMIAWGFGIHSGLDQMVNRLGYLEFVRLVPSYALVVGAAGVIFIGWSYSQYLRFHGRVPRAVRDAVSAFEIAAALGLNPVNLQAWQSERRLTAHHQTDGQLLHVVCGEVPALSAHPFPLPMPLTPPTPPLPPVLQPLPPIPLPPKSAPWPALGEPDFAYG